MSTHTFLYKNLEIAYQDHGHGEVLIFLHGFLESQTMWTQSIEHFKQTHRCIAIDLFGHGHSPCLGYVHTMEKQADMILALIKFLTIKHFSIIGHSMGGYIALAILEKKPKMVKQIVLLNSTSIADNEERKINRERAIAAVKQNHQLFIGMAVANLFSQNSQKKLPNAIERLKEEALNTPKQGVIAALSGMKIRKDRTYLLEENSHKFLIVLGKKDPVLDYESNLSIVKKLQIKQLSLSEGHMSWLENFDEMIEGLKKFLKSNSR